MYKERLIGLLEKIHELPVEEAGFLYDAVKMTMQHCADYVSSVVNMEVGVSIARFRSNDTREYQETVMSLDSSRHNAHEAAIAGVNMMNRICDTLGAERVYDGPDDRTAIGDFCGHIVNELFEGREHGRTITAQEVNQVIDQEIEEIERG